MSHLAEAEDECVCVCVGGGLNPTPQAAAGRRLPGCRMLIFLPGSSLLPLLWGMFWDSP